MITRSRGGHISSQDASLDAQHPILGHFDLPVEIENTPKLSGTHNLSREGWDEDKCRNYLVRVLDWVPRNFNYEDGLRLIHPHLQERFGDENVDLACGVLEELIEIQSPSPFPESVYQRWKHRHLHRRDDLQLPHVPHTTTIVAQVVPTKALLEWRTENRNPEPCLRKSSLQNSADVSPTSPTFSAGISSIAHVESTWRIDHSLFVSVGGRKSSVIYCPSPQEFHRRLWDPSYGRGGTLVGEKSVYMGSIPLENSPSHPKQGSLASLERAELAATLQPKHSRRDPKDGAKSETTSRQILARLWQAFGGKSEEVDAAGSDIVLPHKNVALPRGTHVPHAIFARKHGLVPEGEALPIHLLKGQIQLTADQLSSQQCEHLYKNALETAQKLQDLGQLEENGRWKVEEKAVKSFLYRYIGPPTPGLFFDSGLDFKWDTPNSGREIEALTAKVSPSSHSMACRPSSRCQKGVPYSLGASNLVLSSRRHTVVFAKENFKENLTSLAPMDCQKFHPQLHERHFLRQLIFTRHSIFGLWKRASRPASKEAPRVLDGEYSLATDAVELDELVGSSPNVIHNEEHSMVDNFESGVRNLQMVRERGSSPTGCPTHKIEELKLPSPHSKQRSAHKDAAHQRDGATVFKLPSNAKSSNLPRLTPRMEYSIRAPLDRTSQNTMHKRHLTEIDKAGDSSIMNPKSSQTIQDRIPLQNLYVPGSKPQVQKLRTFDGATDEFHYSPDNNKHFHNTIKHHNKNYENCSVPATFKSSMDPDNAFVRPSASKPLHVRKLSSQIHAAKSQQQLNDVNLCKGYPEQQPYPPRTSSIRKSEHSTGSENFFQPHGTKIDTHSADCPSTRSTLSSYKAHYLSDTSIEAPSTTATTARSALFSYKSHYLSDTSSGIMGDFVPINFPDMNNPSTTAEGSKVPTDTSLNNHRVAPVANPYEFEPGSPYDDEDRQTSFEDFIKCLDTATAPSPRSSHMKNSRSEGNAIYMTRRLSPLVILPPKPSGHNIQRSETSPSVSPLRYPARRDITPSPELSSYHPEREQSCSPTRRGRQQFEDATRRGRQRVENDRRRSPIRHCSQDFAQESPSHSPSRPSRLGCDKEVFSNPSIHGPNLTRSPTKTLEDVFEREEFDPTSPNLSSSPPKKRSRSPMKKMFGEHGWLGTSPDDTLESKLRSKKSSIARKGDPINLHKKTTMMGKLKNKLEEFAEKADLSPIRGFRSDHEKQAKLSLLSVSIGPPEQARFYMEVELMLVHTANSFLMNQFSQGRIAVDSIKKTVDLWKSKGRPIVIEFMYDQATQRDLVSVNQQNFRFHGERAGDDIRINSMLYNWKQVANLMAVRTFCNADTVILKLLFDIEQILELLGAGEAIMLRLQQIRASANEMMRIARQNKNIKSTTQAVPTTRQMVWDPRASFEDLSRSQSMESSYGGTNISPGAYQE